MRFSSKWMIAALATPLVLTAQAPPPGPVGPGPEPNPPAWGQRMGPARRGGQQRMAPRWGMRPGMRGRMGMGMRRGGFGHPGMGLGRLLQNPQVRERLKLTPEQLARIQAQESAAAKTGIRSRADLQVKQMELNELMRAEKPDRALIDKKLRELNDATFADRKAEIDNQLALREMFTLEQRQEMQKMREEFRGRMLERGRGGLQGPRGPRPTGPPQTPPQNPPPTDNGV